MGLPHPPIYKTGFKVYEVGGSCFIGGYLIGERRPRGVGKISGGDLCIFGVVVLQLSPYLPVYVVSRAQEGYALFMADYSQEHTTLFLVALQSDGSMWWIPQTDLRLQWNYSLSRNPSCSPFPPPASSL